MKLIPQDFTMMRCLVALVLGTLALSGCSEFQVPGVYRIDVQQGNIITQEQLAVLELGMEKRKVRFILGTPLVTDAFNQQRWDYYYSLEKSGEERVQRIISVFFEGDLLKRVGGDVLAASGPIKMPERVDKVVTVPDGYRDEGLFASITSGFLSNKPKRQPTVNPVSKEQEQEKEGFLASLVPSFLSTDSAPQTTESVSPPTQSTAPAAPMVTSTAQQPPIPLAKPHIEVDTQDELYLRNLLGDFGRDLASNDATLVAKELPEASEKQANEDGLLSRWTKRLGLDKLKPDVTTPTDENDATSPQLAQ
jgi:outer membrane protein assembly factor BamE